jgi:hypothetical protein
VEGGLTAEANETFGKKEIRVLFLEDVPADADLVNHALEAGRLDFQMRRVDTRDEFLFELESNWFRLFLLRRKAGKSQLKVIIILPVFAVLKKLRRAGSARRNSESF